MDRFHRINPPENGVPPEQVRFENVQVEPWPDGRRVKVLLTITPFLQPPNLEMFIANSEGEEVARTSIVENIDFHLVFTMHIRSASLLGKYTLTATIEYPEIEAVDRREVSFEIQGASSEDE